MLYPYDMLLLYYQEFNAIKILREQAFQQPLKYQQPFSSYIGKYPGVAPYYFYLLVYRD